MLHSQEYNTKGIFRVRFWLLDQWVWINVDDRLPMVEMQNIGPVPWAADAGYANTWVAALIEKAAAKLYGNY